MFGRGRSTHLNRAAFFSLKCDRGNHYTGFCNFGGHVGRRLVVGVSGATGTILAYKTCMSLIDAGYSIDLVMTPSALYTASYEMGRQCATPKRFLARFPQHIQDKITLHSHNDVGSQIASGSTKVDGMIVVPCSMATVAAISCGLGDNCLRRAADVTIKEGRPLILVPRETPLSTIHLENLLKLSKIGVSIIPPVPAWYHNPTSLAEVEDYIVGKVLDALKVSHTLYKEWKAPDIVV